MIERKIDQKSFADVKIKNELYEKKMELLSQEVQKLKVELQNLKEKEIKLDLKSKMQQIYNVCPILDGQYSQKILAKFKMIGPLNIDEILKNPEIQISLDENKIKIDSL